MYIFLDESGTHKQQGKSSVALVYISIEDIERFQDAILKVEKEIRINGFHWSHSSRTDKGKFIAALSKQNFFTKIALIRNPFYGKEAYKYALQYLVVEKNIKMIVIDGKKEKSYERKLKKVLRDRNISAKKLRTGDDRSYPALRAADAIAGLVRYKHENPDDEQTNLMYQKIANKIIITLEQ